MNILNETFSVKQREYRTTLSLHTLQWICRLLSDTTWLKGCRCYSPWTDESGDTKVAIFEATVWAPKRLLSKILDFTLYWYTWYECYLPFRNRWRRVES